MTPLEPIAGDRPLTALVTRPAEDAAPLAAELERRGLRVVLAPMLVIETLPGPAPDLEGVQGLVFTSANGVRAFVGRSDRRDLPVYAVGDATAQTAADQGFGTVRSAAGDVVDLGRLIVESCDPAAGPLLHVAGSVSAGDLAGHLRAAGLELRREVLYDARTAEALDERVAAALAAGQIDLALFFSPRTAATFVTLVQAAGLADACRTVAALCLSPAVAAAASGLDWERVAVADAPNQESLLALLDRGPAGSMNVHTPENPDAASLDAVEVIRRFGGIRPMAAKLGVPVTTVQGWKTRGRIPENRRQFVLDAAAQQGIDLAGAYRETPAAPPEDVPQEGASQEDTSREHVQREAASGEGSREDKAPQPTRDTAGTLPVPPGPAEASTDRPASGIAWLALLVAVGALIALATQPFWIPLLHPAGAFGDRIGVPQMAVRLADLDAQVEDLRGQVAAAKSAAGAGQAGGAERLANLEKRFEDRLSALEQEAKQATRTAPDAAAVEGLRGEIAALRNGLAELMTARVALEGRVAELEKRAAWEGRQAAALALAVGQLETQIDAGRPYRAALERLRGLAGDDDAVVDALAALAPYANDGVPTLDDLRRRFTAIAPELARAEQAARSQAAAADRNGAGGWLDAVWQRISSVISIRRVEGTVQDKGQGTDAASKEVGPVARAEQALARGDLAGAVAALDSPDPAAETWRRQALARLDADNALAALHGEILDALTAGGPAAAASAPTEGEGNADEPKEGGSASGKPEDRAAGAQPSQPGSAAPQ